MLKQLDDALDLAAEVPLGCWSDEELAEWVCGLQARRARLDGLMAAGAWDADRRDVRRVDDASSLGQLVAGRTGHSPAEVRADAKLGVWLSEFREVGDALTAGRISRRHATHLKSLDSPRCHGLLREAQGYLVDAAAGLPWKDFTAVCAQWVANADPDGELADEKIRNRGGHIKTNADGTVEGRFVFDPITGAAVKNAVERETVRLAKDDSETGKNRSYRQRVADAIAGLICQGATTGGTIGNPLLHIIVGQDILESAVARRHGDHTADVSVDPHDPLRRCETVDGTPLHPKEVTSLLPVAVLRRLVLGAGSEILDLGRAVRTFPRHLKQAHLAASRGRCAEPHCDAPLAWLETDHILPWSRGGPTATTNGQTLCTTHNRQKRDREPVSRT